MYYTISPWLRYTSKGCVTMHAVFETHCGPYGLTLHGACVALCATEAAAIAAMRLLSMPTSEA